jgi:hypothetical protein
MGGGAALAVLVAVPLSITAYLGIGSSIPGLDAAKSLMALLEDRSPGDRTAAELTKTKKKAAPEQRALGKVSKPDKPETPSEFVEALAPPPPALSDLPSFPVAVAGLGPLLDVPKPPPGGGGIITTAAPPGGGGGGDDDDDDDTPPDNPPPDNPPVTPPDNPPPPVVPEPGTWATMLLGFGMTGLMIRRRRRRNGTAWA